MQFQNPHGTSSSEYLDSSRAIRSVRSVLHGKRLLLIGGDRREKHLRRIRDAFGLADAIWLPTRRADASSRRIEPRIRDSATDIVVLLLGLTRHQHAHDVPRLCKRYGKPVVRYWRTPNPSGLAVAIIRQIGHRLRITQTF